MSFGGYVGLEGSESRIVVSEDIILAADGNDDKDYDEREDGNNCESYRTITSDLGTVSQPPTVF